MFGSFKDFRSGFIISSLKLNVVLGDFDHCCEILCQVLLV